MVLLECLNPQSDTASAILHALHAYARAGTPLSMISGERMVFQATEARFCHCLGNKVNPEGGDSVDGQMHNVSSVLVPEM